MRTEDLAANPYEGFLFRFLGLLDGTRRGRHGHIARAVQAAACTAKARIWLRPVPTPQSSRVTAEGCSGSSGRTSSPGKPAVGPAARRTRDTITGVAYPPTGEITWSPSTRATRASTTRTSCKPRVQAGRHPGGNRVSRGLTTAPRAGGKTAVGARNRQRPTTLKAVPRAAPWASPAGCGGRHPWRR